MRLPTVLLLVVSTISLASGTASAQERTTFADANGLMWAVGVTELALGVGVVTLVGSDCHGSRCGGAAVGTMLGALALGIGVGTAAGEAGVGPEAPFLFHELLSSAVVGFLPAMVLLNQDSSDDEAFAGATLVGTLTGFGMTIYPFLRRQTLLYDPDAAVGAHLLAWLPIAAGLITTILMAAVDADEEAVVGVSLAMLVAYGLSIAVVEASVGSSTTVGPPTIGALSRSGAPEPGGAAPATFGFSF